MVMVNASRFFFDTNERALKDLPTLLKTPNSSVNARSYKAHPEEM